MFIIILILSIFILLIYNYYVHYERNNRLLNLIPGPSGYPIIGNALQCYASVEELWKMLHTFLNEYYPILKFGIFFFVNGVFISHPDDLETILRSTKHIEKGYFYSLLHPWLNTGLLTSKGVKWQTRRKILTPTFHFNILNQFVDILIKEGDCMAKSLKDVEALVVKNLASFISEHTLNAICETAMGVSLQKFGEFQKQYLNAIHEIFELLLYRIVRPWFYNDMLFSLTSQGRRQKKLLKILHGFTEKEYYCGKKALSPTH